MTLDPSFIERNRASTNRIRALVARLTDEEMQHPLWAAIPPRQAARIAVETAEALDRRLEGLPPALIEEIYAYSER